MSSAIVLLPLALLCVWAGGYAFLAGVAFGGLVVAREWLGMCGCSVSGAATVWFPVVVVATVLTSGLGYPAAGLAIVLVATVWAAFKGGRTASIGHDQATRGGRHGIVSRPGDIDPWASWPVPPRLNLALGVPYLGLAAVALPWLRADPLAGSPNTLFVLAIVWGSDIGAYLVGRLAGGPKLAPATSPGKTWSGAIGGLASAALAGVAVAACLSPETSPSHGIGPGIVLGIISQAGDLLESALKRHFGVKDSGHIIPGHGGLLDRVDALLAVAPVAALLALTVGRGVVLWR